MEVLDTVREFIFDGETFPDPNPEMTIGEVTNHYANLYPEWTTASVDYKETEGNIVRYEVRSSFKEKG